MKNYTSTEMLALWRRALGLEIARTDCTVEVFEGIDLNADILSRMRRWYLSLLDTAPPELLPVADFAQTATITPRSDGGCDIALPAKARRILAVKLSGWKNQAVPLSLTDALPRLVRMASPFAGPGPCQPLAILEAGSLRVYPAADKIELLLAVSDPGPEAYILDETLLKNLKT